MWKRDIARQSHFGKRPRQLLTAAPTGFSAAGTDVSGCTGHSFPTTSSCPCPRLGTTCIHESGTLLLGTQSPWKGPCSAPGRAGRVLGGAQALAAPVDRALAMWPLAAGARHGGRPAVDLVSHFLSRTQLREALPRVRILQEQKWGRRAQSKPARRAPGGSCASRRAAGEQCSRHPETQGAACRHLPRLLTGSSRHAADLHSSASAGPRSPSASSPAPLPGRGAPAPPLQRPRGRGQLRWQAGQQS